MKLPTFEVAIYRLPTSVEGSLARDAIEGLVVSSGVYQIDYQQEGLVLKCPWHQWEFDLATGQALYDETMRVKTYAAGREGEEVVVYVE